MSFQEVEYNILEEQLQKILADLEKREKHLGHAEMEVGLLNIFVNVNISRRAQDAQCNALYV
jgi:hypothetical protein